jgi:hypothetical protein
VIAKGLSLIGRRTTPQLTSHERQRHAEVGKNLPPMSCVLCEPRGRAELLTFRRAGPREEAWLPTATPRRMLGIPERRGINQQSRDRDGAFSESINASLPSPATGGRVPQGRVSPPRTEIIAAATSHSASGA